MKRPLLAATAPMLKTVMAHNREAKAKKPSPLRVEVTSQKKRANLTSIVKTRTAKPCTPDTEGLIGDRAADVEEEEEGIAVVAAAGAVVVAETVAEETAAIANWNPNA